MIPIDARTGADEGSSGEAGPLFVGGSAMAAMMRNHDWSHLSLEHPFSWPTSLRASLTLMLDSGFPMFIAWGDELTFFYNDAYAEILGDKHPSALGRPFREIWAEIWDDIAPLVSKATAGQVVRLENLPLRMNRRGYNEDTFFSFSYSPARDDAGRVVGLFCACNETTEIVLAADRQRHLMHLGDAIRDSEDPDDLAYLASQIIGQALGVSRVGYATIDPDAETLHVARDWNAPGVESLAGVLQLRDYGSFIDSLKRGEFISISDVREDARTAAAAAALESRSARSFVNVPVIDRGRLGAVLYINHAEVRHWTADEIAFVKEVAQRTRTAMERRRVENALRVTDESLRLAVDAAAVGIWDLDLATDVLTWSDRTKAAFGISPDAPCSMADFYAGLHPDDLDPTSAAFATALDPFVRAAYDVEYRTIGKEDDVLRWVAAKGIGIFDTEGRCTRAVGTAIDITSRKRVEQELRNLNETLEQRVAETAADLDRAWRNASDIFVVIDGEGRFQRVNPATNAILG